jgi:putative nucleotidyltransferase with HDIG domain
LSLFRQILAGVFLASLVPTGLVLAVAPTLSKVAIVACVAGLGISIALAITLARKVTARLQPLNTLAQSIARGKFGDQVEQGVPDELGELEKALNYMSASLDAFEAGYLETIVALANSIDSKDSYTRGHSQRVADLAVEIGKELKLSPLELKQLRYGGILHDIGKIGIIESILLKPARLTETEMETMKEHPVIGDRIIKPVRFLSTIRAAVRNHHERWDGKGYPDALAGEAIPLIARIINCSDTWDACTSTRPYQVALSQAQALEIVDRLTGTQLDPKVVTALKAVLARRAPVQLAS